MRNSLERSLSVKKEHLRAALQEVEVAQGVVQEAETRDQEVATVNLRLKGNFDVRVQEVAKLKDEIKSAKEQRAEEVRLLTVTLLFFLLLLLLLLLLPFLLLLPGEEEGSQPGVCEGRL